MKNYFISFIIFIIVFLCSFEKVYAEYQINYSMIIDNFEENDNEYILSTPTSIDKDQQGNYYIADLANNRILKLDCYMNKIGEIQNLDMPITVFIDAQQNILICELGTHKVVKFSPQFIRLTEWGGKGEGVGQFNIPRSITQDSRGNYFVSDELNHRIQKFDINGNYLEMHGEYGDENGQFKVQQGLSMDSQDRLYVADTYNNRIQIFDTYPTWSHLRSFGRYGVYQPFNYFSFQSEIFNHPRNVYVNKVTGNICVTDSLNNRIMVYGNYENGIPFQQSQNGYLSMNLPTDSLLKDNNLVLALDSYNRIIQYRTQLNNTNLFSQYGLGSSMENRFCGPQSIAVDSLTGSVYITDSFNHRIKKYTANGEYQEKYGGIGGSTGIGTLLNYFIFPKQVTVDSTGKLFVADFGNQRIVSKDRESNQFYLEVGSSNLGMPWGVAVDRNGLIYVSDWQDGKIKVFQDGNRIREWGGIGSAEGELNCPSELKIGQYNRQDIIAVADTKNNRIQIFTLTGELVSSIGMPTQNPLENYETEYSQGKLLLPYSMSFDRNGNLFVMDTSHKCMRIFTVNGQWLGSYGYMSSSEGNFFSPMGCDFDEQNNLWVVDGVLQRALKFEVVNQ
ncbi:NHL repeat protein [Peptostreptococcaceae bacterium oral taxon 113 str. W5053]|nr:NHL repeat protein [Peptostreptococcaceae bacterium oral taxon 113 str. W5053]